MHQSGVEKSREIGEIVSPSFQELLKFSLATIEDAVGALTLLR
jgi:hypothetical protein